MELTQKLFRLIFTTYLLYIFFDIFFFSFQVFSTLYFILFFQFFTTFFFRSIQFCRIFRILLILSNFVKIKLVIFFSGKWYISSIIRGQRRNAQSSDSPIECSPSRPSNPGWSRPRRKWIKFRIIFIFWLFLQIDAKQSGNGWRIFYLWKIHSICVDISDQTTFWSFHG